MQRTASYIVKKVLDMLVVGASESSISSPDGQGVIDYLNDYMASIDTLGIKLGYTEVDSMDDIITVPAGAIRGIIANVALLVAPSYDVPVSTALALQAKAGQKAMLRIVSGVGPTAYPSTLPRGSGNTGRTGRLGGVFYPEPTDTILNETGGSIGLEDDTGT